MKPPATTKHFSWLWYILRQYGILHCEFGRMTTGMLPCYDCRSVRDCVVLLVCNSSAENTEKHQRQERADSTQVVHGHGFDLKCQRAANDRFLPPSLSLFPPSLACPSFCFRSLWTR
eukprot:420830-Rhodomonas_salina.1